MTKSELIDKIHEGSSGVTKVQVSHVVDIVLDSIQNALFKGDKMEIRGFGTFRIRQRDARKGRNPKTGQVVEVPRKKVPYFKAGKELKKKVADNK